MAFYSTLECVSAPCNSRKIFKENKNIYQFALSSSRHLQTVLEQHRPMCRRNGGGEASEAAPETLVKQERDTDSVDIFAADIKQSRDSFEAGRAAQYKYGGGAGESSVYGDSGVNYNFTYTGGYYDTACFAV